jgi:hypothetical protein
MPHSLDDANLCTMMYDYDMLFHEDSLTSS